MKYIKELNIDFNNWEEIEDDTNIILDTFFFRNPIGNNCDELYFRQYSLLITINSLPYIDRYLEKKELNITWQSGDNLIDLSKKYLNNSSKEINLVLNEKRKILQGGVYSNCYNILDFRK